MALGSFLSDVGAGIGRGVLALGTGGISEYRRAQDEEQQRKLADVVRLAANPQLPLAEKVNALADIGTPEAIKYAMELSKPQDLPTSVQEFQAMNKMAPEQQQAYREFKDPAAAVSREKALNERNDAVAKMQDRFASTRQKTAVLLGSHESPGAIDRAIGRVSNWSAGLGAKLAWLGGNDAADLEGELDTIRANLGFDELQQMRDNSPTGGALGQVAIQELERLESTVNSLKQRQRPETLKAQLARLKTYVREKDERIQKAYLRDLARFGSKAMEGVNSEAAPKGNGLTGLTTLPAGFKDIGNGMVQGPDGKKYRMQRD